MNLAFTDIPNGLKGAAMVPLAGALPTAMSNASLSLNHVYVISLV
jgi:hypothetical protein